MSEKAAYLGRFQPFSNHHTQVVADILRQYPDIQLCVGIADFHGPRTQDNFLSGPEAQEIAQIALDEAHLPVKAHTVELHPQVPLETSLEMSFVAHGIRLLFSGSEKTIAAANYVVREKHLPLEVVPLVESTTSPHAVDIRNSILRGDSLWQSLVAQGVVAYFNTHPELVTRLSSLPINPGEKRPWTSLAASQSASHTT